MHEINVPTCSYRMGVKEMAFGLAAFDFASGDVTYVNLWLPSRFSLLYLYIMAVILAWFLFVLGKRFPPPRRGGSRRRSSTASANLI